MYMATTSSRASAHCTSLTDRALKSFRQKNGKMLWKKAIGLVIYILFSFGASEWPQMTFFAQHI